MLSDRLLSSRDCRGTINLCGHFGECHSTRANRIGEVDRGFGFVVLSIWVVNWKQTRRDANKRNPEDNDHPTQILHGKVTRSREQNTPGGLPCQCKKNLHLRGNPNDRYCLPYPKRKNYILCYVN